MYFTLGSIMSTVPEKTQDILSDVESIASSTSKEVPNLQKNIMESLVSVGLPLLVGSSSSMSTAAITKCTVAPTVSSVVEPLPATQSSSVVSATEPLVASNTVSSNAAKTKTTRKRKNCND